MELKILLAILSIASALITGLLIPYLKSKIDQTQRAKTLDMIAIAVKAAEQIYTRHNEGKSKKAFVLEWLRSKGIKLSENELNVFIEAAVRELNQAKTKARSA